MSGVLRRGASSPLGAGCSSAQKTGRIGGAERAQLSHQPLTVAVLRRTPRRRGRPDPVGAGAPAGAQVQQHRNGDDQGKDEKRSHGNGFLISAGHSSVEHLGHDAKHAPFAQRSAD